MVSTRNPIMFNKRAADPVHPDLDGLLVKNKNLLAELRNLQNKLLVKQTSVQEIKSELESYKENNVKQSFQIMSLKNDIKDLEELIASLTRIKSLKSINVHSLERVNWDLNESITELENRLRVHLVEKEKAEQKTKLLEKKLAGANELTPHMNTKGQEDTLSSFMMKDKGKAILAKNCERDNIFHSEGPNDGQKIWDKCQQDLIHTEKQEYNLDRPPYSCSWEAKTAQCHSQEFLGQLAPPLSDSAAPVLATEEVVKERIREVGAHEQSWKLRTEGLQQEIQMLTKRLEQVHPHHCEESSQTEEKCGERKRPLKRLEGKIAINDFFQERLDLGRNKDKTIQKLRQSLIKVEAMRGKAVVKMGNLKTPLDSAEQEASWDKDRAHQMVGAVTPGLCTAKSTLEDVSGRPQERVDFRETIMRMLGFNVKTADKKIITHLRLIIQAYEASDKSKVASNCETGRNNA
ncbi:coiled-coil domain-containing protein 170-like [Sturnira hondurensis]|uniref:coiled-coil domain-containing protein 170-like n=1 Tax=Sturnira hondurensis TaxID=192404 RepID=UPI001879765A|nr:coiled-coil domain-containing protein 170-like [Sturnira hondurensis]